MDHREDEKVALITGSGRRRVGNAVARMLAARGYRIALHYQQSESAAMATVAELGEQGAASVAIKADVSSADDVDRLFDAVQSQFGRLDVLVTAAAIWEPKRLEEVTADDVRRHFEVNALGTFLCCRTAGLIMAAQPEGGSIVTIGDWATSRPYPNYVAYFSSKGAVEAMTRSLAVELSLRNPAVRVNCVLPGPVLLPENLPPGERVRAVADTLVGHVGRAENVGQAVLFFIENDFVTGVCLPVDGGRTISSKLGG